MVKKILRTVGATMTVEDYRRQAMRICATGQYTFEKAIGSLGGSVSKGVVRISNGMVIRLI